ncbi:MAG: twin-arginine translocase subunit TatB [Pseudomonadota bacterium]|jgi:sec-independent protein translocase protein TatB
MLDIGWSELLIIGVVALIVVGPKDLPMMFRTLGRFTGKMRAMARDFQRAMDDAAKQAGVDEVAKDLRSMTSKSSLGLNALDEAASKFEKWDPVKNAAKPTKPIEPAKPITPPPMPATPAPAAAAPVAPAAGMGPETKALAERQAAQRADRAEKARAARAAKAAEAAPAVAEPAPADVLPPKPARRRKAAEKKAPDA